MLFFRRLLLLLPWIRRARERELEQELRTHFDLAAESARAEGLADRDARSVARRQTNSIEHAREDARAVWGFRTLERVQQDLRYALRTAWRSPGFTLVSLISTAGGIAAATVVFSLVQGVLLRPLPYRDADRIVSVREVVPPLERLYPTLPVNAQHFRTWKREARAFEALAAVNADTVTLTGAGEPERVDLMEASADLFSVLGVHPSLGRGITADDEARRSRVVIISHSLWLQRFGGTADILGRALVLDGVPHTVVGVLPASFWFPSGADLGPLARLGTQADLIRPLGAVTRLSEGWGGDYDLNVFGRLRADVSPQQARAELDAIETRIVAAHRGVSPGLRVVVEALHEVITGPVRTGLYVLMLCVLALLAVVCVNLAALLLARTMGRAREFSIRTAIGAGRGRLFQQVLFETLLLVGVGGALGIAGATATLRAIVAAGVLDLPRGELVQVDGSVVQFALLLVFACALAVAWLPASHIASMDPQRLLRTNAGSFSASRRTLRLRAWLVAGETAISTVLLIGAGLLVASFGRVLHVERGFSADHAIATRLTIAEARYPSKDNRNAFFERTLEEIRRLPGVASAAFVSGLPLTGESQVNGIQLEGSDAEAIDPDTRDLVTVNVRFVSPDYFQTLGIRLKGGRAIAWSDRTRRVAVISQQLATKVWPGRDPIGRRFATGSGVGQVEVVGIVGDVHNAALEAPVTPIVYVPFWMRGPLWGDVIVRSLVDERALAPAVRRAVWTVDPGVPVPAMRTIADVVSEAVRRRRFQVQMAAGFALAALLLTVLGIYGVVAYGVVQRRKEIGIRVALGARPREVLAATLKIGLVPVSAGVAGGLVTALAGGRFMQALLFGVSPLEPVVIGGAVALLTTVAIAATLLPARAASHVDPLQVLRTD
jgi:putative ABC transport system permease protein